MREPVPRSDNRKYDFLDAALELFHEKGYDKTTINDIIDKMGVSKGAFYHYFKSKEDVIIEIANGYVNNILGLMKHIVGRKGIDAVEKLNAMFLEVNQSKKQEEHRRSKMKGIFDGEKNLKLERKISIAVYQEAVEVFQEIFEQGIKEGLFTDLDPEELADYTFSLIQNLNKSIDRLHREYRGKVEFAKKLDVKLRFYEGVINTVLRLEEGTVGLREAYWKRFFPE